MESSLQQEERVVIETIVNQALQTRVLTFRQQCQIEVLLRHQRYTSTDLEALRQLEEALAAQQVVTGANSLSPSGWA
jgi:hypothetical protein